MSKRHEQALFKMRLVHRDRTNRFVIGKDSSRLRVVDADIHVLEGFFLDITERLVVGFGGESGFDVFPKRHERLDFGRGERLGFRGGEFGIGGDAIEFERGFFASRRRGCGLKPYDSVDSPEEHRDSFAEREFELADRAKRIDDGVSMSVPIVTRFESCDDGVGAEENRRSRLAV